MYIIFVIYVIYKLYYKHNQDPNSRDPAFTHTLHWSHLGLVNMSYLSRWEVGVVVIWEVDSPVVHGMVEGVPGELPPRHPH